MSVDQPGDPNTPTAPGTPLGDTVAPNPSFAMASPGVGTSENKAYTPQDAPPSFSEFLRSVVCKLQHREHHLEGEFKAQMAAPHAPSF